QWRKTNKAVAEGKLLHYAPGYDSECYVYARIAGDSKVIVIVNGSEKEQILHPQQYAEIIGTSSEGKDVVSGKTVSLKKEITVSGKGVYVLEL
ncbi:MAG: cyclomaltodextrinase C-terminal domain-containing protein, partial [Dysgonamonadaceae bacterium]|nr:cyclomaltodextrinase C-terminal domain-containing protein [Dysgonamonadaceae bacterium]